VKQAWETLHFCLEILGWTGSPGRGIHNLLWDFAGVAVESFREDG
jgi:hypothetical protein